MSVSAYTKTTYVNNTTPAINATNLNNIEQQVSDISTAVLNGGASPTKVWTDTNDGNLLPVGSIIMYSLATAPTGYLLCDGSAVSRTTYSRLFAVIGTTWGAGDTTTTFNVPDMRAAAPVGQGTSTGYTENETYTLAQKYNDQAQGHHHFLSRGSPGGTGGVQASTFGTDYATTDLTTGAMATDGTNGTPRTGKTTRGKLVGVNFCIRY